MRCRASWQLNAKRKKPLRRSKEAKVAGLPIRGSVDPIRVLPRPEPCVRSADACLKFHESGRRGSRKMLEAQFLQSTHVLNSRGFDRKKLRPCRSLYWLATRARKQSDRKDNGGTSDG